MKQFSVTIHCDTAEQLGDALEAAAEEARVNADLISTMDVDESIEFDGSQLDRIA